MSSVIQVSSLGKKYHIGTLHQDTLRDQLVAGFQKLFGTSSEDTPTDLWALKDVSFEVNRGEVVGIIGRNGAGKSTLLKILSRITQPTTGTARILGRVGSLLEVGTGFHPELTGRENIYLNGAILGMTRREIEQKFDEIVDFAEIHKFIDTPVKRYSSGMYVRLAFAVAAHLEPEILLVDEVLAVGDIAFQRKCLGKMSKVAGEGRTVIFVSHNMGAVQTLCDRALYLRDGILNMDDTVDKVVAHYLQGLEQLSTQDLNVREDRRGVGEIRLTGVKVESLGEVPGGTLATGLPARFKFTVTRTKRGMACTFTIYDQHGHPVATFRSAKYGPRDSYDPGLGNSVICDIDELLLVPGRYRINAAITCKGVLQDHMDAVTHFDVEPGQLSGRGISGGRRYGNVVMDHVWHIPTRLQNT
jgi:lipopolysaccharide transport system ATP-binding protein